MTLFQFVLVQKQLRPITGQSLEVIVIFFKFDYILLDRRNVKINPHFSQLNWSGLVQVQNS